jgi:uncharacterized membrane protein (UPF0127 family)
MKRLLVFLCFAVVVFACKDASADRKVETAKISFTKEGELTIAKANGDVITKFDIEFAENDYERETGLMYRTSMNDTEAMLFIFPESLPRSFYMKNTYVPLDIIYLDENKKIVGFQKDAKPLNESGLPSEVPAMYVLEIKAGLADKWSLEIGDIISFSRL